jgi:hypothetical protein
MSFDFDNKSVVGQPIGWLHEHGGTGANQPPAPSPVEKKNLRKRGNIMEN